MHHTTLFWLGISRGVGSLRITTSFHLFEGWSDPETANGTVLAGGADINTSDTTINQPNTYYFVLGEGYVMGDDEDGGFL